MDWRPWAPRLANTPHERMYNLVTEIDHAARALRLTFNDRRYADLHAQADHLQALAARARVLAGALAPAPQSTEEDE